MSATIFRDTYGVPHIVADSNAEAAFAVGYAQAEDRLEALLLSFRKALGRMAEISGPEFIDQDAEKILLQIPEMGKIGLASLSKAVREMLNAYVAGVERYTVSHPYRIPDGSHPPLPEDIVSLSYWFTIQWSLRKVKQEFNATAEEDHQHSNTWALTPGRTANGKALLLIDPHVPWEGGYRWYEMHLHSPDLQCAGFTLLGLPLPVLGFNRWVAWATTTGGPDCADVYRLCIDTATRRYRCGNAWTALRTTSQSLPVSSPAGILWKTIESNYTDFGPVIHNSGTEGFALRLAYWGQTGVLEQLFRMNRARNLRQFESALAMQQFPEMNVCAADAEGSIGYWSSGRCPRRDASLDWSRPVETDDSRSQWHGIHPLGELPRLMNPRCGFVQNCNVTPDHVIPGSPLRADAFPSYMFYTHSGDVYRPRSDRALELLSRERAFSIADAEAMAMDKRVLPAMKWTRELARLCAGRSLPDAHAEALSLLQKWDGCANADSPAALLFLVWRGEFQKRRPEVGSSNEHHCIPFDSDSGEQAFQAFDVVVDQVKREFPTRWPALGEVQRLERGGRSLALGGGGVRRLGLQCLRAIETEETSGTQRRWRGVGGNSCPTLVCLSDSPEAWSVVPFGQSDDPGSPHFADQMDLFAAEEFKPMWFGPEQLQGCIESVTEL